VRTRELKDHDDWDAFLHKVTFALRAAYHTMTGASPAQLAFGRDMLVDLRHETDWGKQKEKKLQHTRCWALSIDEDGMMHVFGNGGQVFFNELQFRQIMWIHPCLPFVHSAVGTAERSWMLPPTPTKRASKIQTAQMKPATLLWPHQSALRLVD
jgi:hypothetical protein